MTIKRLISELSRLRAKIQAKSSNRLIVLLTITLIILVSVGSYLSSRLANKGHKPGVTASFIRSPEEREAAIERIKEFAGSDAQIEYLSVDRSIYNSEIIEESYRVGLDVYVINAASDDVVFFGEAPRIKDEDPQKQYDWTPRYSRQQLEKMARTFIAKYEPKVDLTSLIPKHAHYDNRSFFRWEDTSGNLSDPKKAFPFIQIGYSIGGTILSYTNTLDY